MAPAIISLIVICLRRRPRSAKYMTGSEAPRHGFCAPGRRRKDSLSYHLDEAKAAMFPRIAGDLFGVGRIVLVVTAL